MSLEKLTPQLAKMIVFELQKQSLEHIKNGAFWKEDHTLSIQEKQIMKEAVINELEALQAKINYQKRIS